MQAAKHLRGEGGLVETVRGLWRAKLHVVDVPSMPFLAREMAWHSFNLHAAVTYDSYFNEYMVDQGTAYRSVYLAAPFLCDGEKTDVVYLIATMPGTCIGGRR